eukprot:TRINITY_DN7500_c2_g1_i2.p1 TRINITY_DN7500_c2_g1~~TRINITY_DN7500_c2_g1_i2.p1  ORF type:complete len:187 (+),score=20.57 TRINITY_DN7500_c2_g1_i2:541-1101(+)
MKFVKIVSKVTSLTQLELNFGWSKLNDSGCAAVAHLLRSIPMITYFSFLAWKTEITDIGISYLASELPALPLQQLDLSFHCEGITDRGVEFLTESFRGVSPTIDDLHLSLEGTQVSDAGFIPLLQQFTNLPVLSYFSLSLEKSGNITDESINKLAEFLERHPPLVSITLDLRNLYFYPDFGKNTGL